MIKDNDLLVRLGAEIRAARKAKKLTLEQLGQRVNLSPPTLSRIERGSQVIAVEQLLLFADVLETWAFLLVFKAMNTESGRSAKLNAAIIAFTENVLKILKDPKPEPSIE